MPTFFKVHANHQFHLNSWFHKPSVDNKQHPIQNIFYKVNENSFNPVWLYNWDMSNWNECSVKCGGGIQNRSVTCKRSDGFTVDDRFCSNTIHATTKPNTQQACNTQTCIVDYWHCFSLTACGTKCGNNSLWSYGTICRDAGCSNGLGCDRSKLKLSFSSPQLRIYIPLTTKRFVVSGGHTYFNINGGPRHGGHWCKGCISGGNNGINSSVISGRVDYDSIHELYLGQWNTILYSGNPGSGSCGSNILINTTIDPTEEYIERGIA
jgi:hypothetical protein